MSANGCIDLLIDLMEQCHIPKQELLEAINQVHYYSALPSPSSSPKSSPKSKPKVAVTRVSKSSTKPALYEINMSEINTLDRKSSSKSSLCVISQRNSVPNLSSVTTYAKSCRNNTPYQLAKSSSRNFTSSQISQSFSRNVLLNNNSGSKSFYRSIKHGSGPKSFVERSVVYEAARAGNIQQAKDTFTERERKICSFRPKINNTSPRRSKEPIHVRLYEMHEKIIQQNEVMKARKDAHARAEEILECSFKPNIYSKNAKSRFMLKTNSMIHQSKVSNKPTVNKVEPSSFKAEKKLNKFISNANKSREALEEERKTYRDKLLLDVLRVKQQQVQYYQEVQQKQQSPPPSQHKKSKTSKDIVQSPTLEKHKKLQMLRDTLAKRIEDSCSSFSRSKDELHSDSYSDTGSGKKQKQRRIGKNEL